MGTIKAIENGQGTLRTLIPVLAANGQKLAARHAPGDHLISGLVALRKRHGLSARRVAALLSMSRSTIAEMENGGDSRIITVAEYAALVGAGLMIVPDNHSPSFYTSTGNASVFHGWHTPRHLFETVESIVGRFNLDPCAPDDHGGAVRADIKFSAMDDGLSREWRGNVFMNPPYGTMIRQWIVKARIEAASGAKVIGLIPARTDTQWWHENINALADVVFLKGRLSFGDGKQAAPFPSAIVLWGFDSGIAEDIASATGGFSVIAKSRSLRRSGP